MDEQPDEEDRSDTTYESQQLVIDWMYRTLKDGARRYASNLAKGEGTEQSKS